MNTRILYLKAHPHLKDAKITGIRYFRYIFGTDLNTSKGLVELMIDGQTVTVRLGEQVFMEAVSTYLNHKPAGWYVTKVENFQSPSFDLTIT